ncbi:AAA family ATPase [Bacillus toyonensis]|uniref:AAA family ATPase n=1 Tax=Bacillus toyonensis TaxID=155322 RepID=UPI001904A92B|nr:AAA family ATPase [Bacillus toyonensis]QQN86671.1 AAA family ATPase [Bacillus toyonensis]
MIKVNRGAPPQTGIELENEIKKLQEYINFVILENESIKRKNIIKTFKEFNLKGVHRLNQDWYRRIYEVFNYKCAYCETSINIYSQRPLDHFRPLRVADNQSEFGIQYVWLAYDWNNLYPVCTTCSNNKMNVFPVRGKRINIYEETRKEKAMLIDPCFDLPEKHLYFDSNGKVFAKTEKGKHTIDLLKLNRSDLVFQREGCFHQCGNVIDNDITDLLLIEHRAVVKQYLANYLRAMHDDELKSFINVPSNKRVLEELYQEKITMRKMKSIILTFSNNNRLLPEESYREYQRAFIKNLVVNNIRGISFKHEFQFRDKTPWLMILGENGTGKTTLLQAITLGLVGEDTRLRIGNISYSYNEGSVIITFKDKLGGNQTFFHDRNRYSKLDIKDIAVAAYGAVRIISKNVRELDFRDSIHDVKNLFPTSNYSHFLVNPSIWLKSERDIQKVSEAILEILPIENFNALEFHKYSNKFYVSFKDNSKMELQELSSGYQTIIALILDIMRTICSTDANKGRYSDGIILIDEIDAHLHPSWKIKIVEQLRIVFPNIQFIATTHDPLCLRGLEKDEIIVIKKENGRRNVLTELPYQGDLRIDQLLTSDLFGLYSTLDPAMNDLLNEKYINLNKSSSNMKNKEENSVSKENVNIKYFGYQEKERIMFEIIDEAIARKKANRTLKIDDKTAKKILDLWGLND